MIRKSFFFACVVFVFGFGQGTFVHEIAVARSDEKEFEDGRKLFLDVSIALSEERFEDAYAMAERLIRDYASDYQIRQYLSLYADTFFLSHEEHRKGGIPPFDSPPPQWLKTEVEAMMSKPDKSLLDLVKLVSVADKRICGENFPVSYLEEIISRFPESTWVDWAEWILIQKKEYRPRDKYRDKSYKERRKLLARDMYNARKKFIQEHSNSHMVPGLLHVMADDCLIISNDEAAKQEAIKISRKILKEYPSDEYHCAISRLRSRKLLGNLYEENGEFTEKEDRVISRFYSRKFYLPEYKSSVRQYLSVKKDLEAQTEKASEKPALLEDRGLSATAYLLLSMTAIAGVAVVIVLLVRKKAQTKRDSHN